MSDDDIYIRLSKKGILKKQFDFNKKKMKLVKIKY